MFRDSPAETAEFEGLGREQEPGFLRKMRTYINEERIWWMGPIILVLLLAGVLVGLSSTGAAPFIYSLF